MAFMHKILHAREDVLSANVPEPLESLARAFAKNMKFTLGKVAMSAKTGKPLLSSSMDDAYFNAMHTLGVNPAATPSHAVVWQLDDDLLLEGIYNDAGLLPFAAFELVGTLPCGHQTFLWAFDAYHMPPPPYAIELADFLAKKLPIHCPDCGRLTLLPAPDWTSSVESERIRDAETERTRALVD